MYLNNNSIRGTVTSLKENSFSECLVKKKIVLNKKNFYTDFLNIYTAVYSYPKKVTQEFSGNYLASEISRFCLVITPLFNFLNEDNQKVYQNSLHAKIRLLQRIPEIELGTP